MNDIDLTSHTYRSACPLAVESARGPDGSIDRPKASTELARLLWHVPAEDGGFVGLDDEARERKAANDPRLAIIDIDTINAFAWDAGHWPEASNALALAAE